MAGLNDTLARIARLRGYVQQLRADATALATAAGDSLIANGPAQHLQNLQQLQPIVEFGPNPGNLRMHVYQPPIPAARPAVVVVLHGCAETPQLHDLCSGWSTLAQRQGFVVVYPEQQQSNNSHLCFNWFDPAHARRDKGEAASIRQMVAYAQDRFGSDPDRVYVTGLSAGAAMANAMLASYPDVFAGGAVIAGLPFGAATNVSEAMQMMAKGRHLPARVWAQHVRTAADLADDHANGWPRLSVWHGDADTVVHPANAEATLAQWVNVHGVSPAPDAIEIVAGHRRRIWRDDNGDIVVEAWSIAGLGHAVPLAIDTAGPLGRIGPFHAQTGVSATARIAAFWGLMPKPPQPPPGSIDDIE